MKSITRYYISSFVNLLVLVVFLNYSFKYFLTGNITLFTIWFILFTINLRDLVDRQKNFMKYYPLFEDKWLNSII